MENHCKPQKLLIKLMIQLSPPPSIIASGLKRDRQMLSSSPLRQINPTNNSNILPNRNIIDDYSNLKRARCDEFDTFNLLTNHNNIDLINGQININNSGEFFINLLNKHKYLS
jgi:hypothetical protein